MTNNKDTKKIDKDTKILKKQKMQQEVLKRMKNMTSEERKKELQIGNINYKINTLLRNNTMATSGCTAAASTIIAFGALSRTSENNIFIILTIISIIITIALGIKALIIRNKNNKEILKLRKEKEKLINE